MVNVTLAQGCPRINSGVWKVELIFYAAEVDEVTSSHTLGRMTVTQAQVSFGNQSVAGSIPGCVSYMAASAISV